MARVKKDVALDTALVERIRLRLGGDTSLTPIINQLLTEFADILEERDIEIPTLIKDAAVNARRNIEDTRET